MIELSNSQAQTIQPGAFVTFDVVKLHTGCGECFNRELPNSAKLCATDGVYELHFSGNVTSSADNTALQLAMAVVGAMPLSDTAMNVKPATAGDLWNVHTSTLFRNGCCDANRIGIANIGTAPVTIAPNSSFYIVRQA